MASRRKYRKTWLRWHRQYERRAYRELQKTFHAWGNNIPWDILTEFNYQMEIKLALVPLLMEETIKDIYTKIGLVHGNRVGRAVNKELKAFTSEAFSSTFLRELNRFLARYGMQKVVSVQSTYFEEIVRLFQVRLGEDMTIQQAAREIQRIVARPNFYRWQALRIARTETTSAANFAATRASSVTGFIMEKEWVSALDARTRRAPDNNKYYDHYEMNGERVGQYEMFKLPGKFGVVEEMMYPGDQENGSEGNTINCRCSAVVVPKRDENGELVRTA